MKHAEKIVRNLGDLAFSVFPVDRLSPFRTQPRVPHLNVQQTVVNPRAEIPHQRRGRTRARVLQCGQRRHLAQTLAAARVANQFAREALDGVLAAVEAVAAAVDGAEGARAELCA